MKCKNCGARIETGQVYCPVCGKESAVVDDIEILEDDLLRAMLEGEEEAMKAAAAQAESADDSLEILSQKRDKKREKKRKMRRRSIIILIIVIAAAIAACFAFIYYKNNHSVDYLLEKAQDAYEIKEYQESLSYLEKLLALDEDNVDALLLEGTIYYDIKDYDTAKELLLYMISLDPSNIDAYAILIEVYEDEDDYDSIVSLMEGVEDEDEDVLALFADHILEAPEVDTPAGTYNEFLEVKVTASENAVYIYYTTDGTDPTDESELYEDSIYIYDEGETVLKIVCADEKGNFSEITKIVYEINLEAPDMPEATPEGGTFTVQTSITVTVPDDCTVYYTWDNTDPTSSSEKYTGVIEMIEGNNVLSLIAIDSNGMESQVQRYNFVYIPQTDDE